VTSVSALVVDLADRSRFPAGVAFVRRAERLDGGAEVVVVDLGVAGALDAVRSLRAAGSTAHVVAYGRHTDRELLAAARAAGCDRVLARSAFFADVAAALTIR
jgi:DNA-binding NarL/FixJ family response regulator